MSKKIMLSGIQPSGNLTIGNYIGAIRQWVALQNDYHNFFMIVDLHALTVPQDPAILRAKTLEVAKLYIASGIDPAQSTIFVQSHVPEHAELSWILSTITKMSELERMTQYKDKALRHKMNVNVGLFSYPVLMATDILLYQTDLVPVGEDQTQHLELTRILARRFNEQFGITFKAPEGYFPKHGARIMGLDNPQAKMSKSSTVPGHAIALLDDAKAVEKKIKRAVTDSGSEIKSGADKPALTNLLTIFSAVTGRAIAALEKEYKGAGYSAFKIDLADTVNAFLKPLQEKYHSLSDKKITSVLEEGARAAHAVAAKTLTDVRKKVGLI
ncbi:MAG: Tryptophan-tRNA ligase [Candidatus Magasanikbacteria bacterium GW2011_GWA2_46_17]|uniref:Tryptophan--tRNA ligase n=1 Tax=Candidatus Magasanikbacteria bacterium GW2011_GWA2_46_17 TaxID=1619042 RepID=A0A0G1P2W4_9BACT|nr:MAG: Tryptophan-tRNA ligase [Candidatus Magasanikbacteria bacterium GW2011_GWA2_46_17]HBF67164.1 tryptophan--tRNA ligase [Candidatus Magasanikbacteria bacterium]